MLKSFLFWQPRKNLLTFMCKSKTGSNLLVVLNYLIWLFLAFISLLLVKYDPNIFWQLFLSTLLAEIIERFSKAFFFWSRPIGKYKQNLPKGLVKSWYDTGSFPSGHTSKALFFLLYILKYKIFSPIIYLLVTIPLLLFRVIVGFHYPIDILGGAVVGYLVFLISSQIIFPSPLIQFVSQILNLFFK